MSMKQPACTRCGYEISQRLGEEAVCLACHPPHENTCRSGLCRVTLLVAVAFVGLFSATWLSWPLGDGLPNLDAGDLVAPRDDEIRSIEVNLAQPEQSGEPGP